MNDSFHVIDSMLNLQQNACQSRKEAIQDPNVLDNDILQQLINPSPQLTC